MRYVGLGRNNLRSHFVFGPRHAPEWLRARFLPVVFLANEEELTGKTFTTSLYTTNPNKYMKFIFLRTSPLRQDPLDLSFWSFSTFLHHDIEEVERHLLWKFYNKIRRKSWSNVPPKVLACIGFLYKVVHKIGRLRKFNRSREIEFNFLTAWTIPMKFGTLVQHAPGYKNLPQIF